MQNISAFKSSWMPHSIDFHSEGLDSISDYRPFLRRKHLLFQLFTWQSQNKIQTIESNVKQTPFRPNIYKKTGIVLNL